LETEIIEIISNFLRKNVNLDTSLIDPEGFVNSLDIAAMVYEIEKKYNISFEDDLNLDYLDNVESMITAVKERLN